MKRFSHTTDILPVDCLKGLGGDDLRIVSHSYITRGLERDGRPSIFRASAPRLCAGRIEIIVGLLVFTTCDIDMQEKIILK